LDGEKDVRVAFDRFERIDARRNSTGLFRLYSGQQTIMKDRSGHIVVLVPMLRKGFDGLKYQSKQLGRRNAYRLIAQAPEARNAERLVPDIEGLGDPIRAK
jgi:hypothetical protein